MQEPSSLRGPVEGERPASSTSTKAEFAALPPHAMLSS